jgi:hypothetical protein
MPLPRLRIRTVMILVAIVAFGISIAGRPRPVWVYRGIRGDIILWSDGTVTHSMWVGADPAMRKAEPARWHRFGLIEVIEWDDSSKSRYLVGPLTPRGGDPEPQNHAIALYRFLEPSAL